MRCGDAQAGASRAKPKPKQTPRPTQHPPTCRWAVARSTAAVCPRTASRHTPAGRGCATACPPSWLQCSAPWPLPHASAGPGRRAGPWGPLLLTMLMLLTQPLLHLLPFQRPRPHQHCCPHLWCCPQPGQARCRCCHSGAGWCCCGPAPARCGPDPLKPWPADWLRSWPGSWRGWCPQAHPLAPRLPHLLQKDRQECRHTCRHAWAKTNWHGSL